MKNLMQICWDKVLLTILLLPISSYSSIVRAREGVCRRQDAGPMGAGKFRKLLNPQTKISLANQFHHV